MHAKSLQLCWLCHPMDCSLPDSSARGIPQARILEWVAMLFSRGSSWPRDQTCVSPVLEGRLFTTSTTWEELWSFTQMLLSTRGKKKYPFLRKQSFLLLDWRICLMEGFSTFIKLSISGYTYEVKSWVGCRVSLSSSFSSRPIHFRGPIAHAWTKLKMNHFNKCVFFF